LLSALPRLFRQAGEHSAQSQRLNRLIYLSVLAYGLALAGALWLIAPIMQWLFGSQYHGIADMLRWLCIAVPGLVLRLTVASILMTMDKPWLRAAFEIFGMVVLAVAAFGFYPAFGPIGMALAVATSEWGMVICGFFILKNINNEDINS
jgi:O-antigen/teichoic acid export membrane protein